MPMIGQHQLQRMRTFRQVQQFRAERIVLDRSMSAADSEVGGGDHHRRDGLSEVELERLRVRRAGEIVQMRGQLEQSEAQRTEALRERERRQRMLVVGLASVGGLVLVIGLVAFLLTRDDGGSAAAPSTSSSPGRSGRRQPGSTETSGVITLVAESPTR